MMRQLSLGLILLSLPLLTGCSGKEQPPQVQVPEMLLRPCHDPVWQGRTNGDLIEFITELKIAIGLCSADKMAIKAIIERQD